MLLFASAPTVTAARNDVMALSIIPNTNIRNPLANIFFTGSVNPTENCVAAGSPCSWNGVCCSKKCQLSGDYPFSEAYCL
ncbi:hypothetical protein V6N13_033146 [Hibiscus sabdariffa]